MNHQPMSKVQLFSAYCLAVMTTFTCASFFHSQMVISRLSELGVSIGIGLRLSYTFEDWIGLLPGYGSIIAVGLLLGFSIIYLCRKRLKLNSVLLFGLGGMTSLLVIHLAMYPIMHITLIAGARSELGFILQVLSGLVGGLTFGALFQKIKQR